MTLVAVARRRTPPLVAPYNAPTYATTPTPDGTGSLLHPDVIDFRQINGGTWHGWRYWMAVTPYFNTNDNLENPCVLVSQDGQTWQVPSGLTNPIYPWPGGSQYNSDTDLVYDPDADEVVLIYRNGDLHPHVARSADGVTWPPQATAITYTKSGEIVSPAVIRVGPGQWHMYACQTSTGNVQRWTSANLLTWTGPQMATGLDAIESWHIDVIRHDGKFYALINTYDPASDNIYAATSSDGLAWMLNTAPVIAPSAGGWDSQWLYRATLQPHERGDRFRVWYSALGPVASWRVGYTQIPLAEWPTA